jgi:hypothetical protein
MDPQQRKTAETSTLSTPEGKGGTETIAEEGRLPDGALQPEDVFEFGQDGGALHRLDFALVGCDTILTITTDGAPATHNIVMSHTNLFDQAGVVNNDSAALLQSLLIPENPPGQGI